MTYDDRYNRRSNDDDAPRRSGGGRGNGDDGYDGPRSGQPSRNSRPRDAADAGYADRRSGSPSRGRGDDYRESGRPSRARDDYGPRMDDPRGEPRSRGSRSRDDGYGDRGSRRRRDDGYGDQGTSRRSRDDGSRGEGARDVVRRMRDRLTGAYEAMSREVRSLGRRDDPRRSAGPSRSRRDEHDAPPPRNREFIDDSVYAGAPAPPSRTPSRPGSSGGRTAAAQAAAKNAHSRSLAMRLINRRKRVRVGKIPPGAKALTATVLALLGVLLIVGGGVGTGYAYAIDQQYAAKIAEIGLSRDLQSSRIYDRHGKLLYQTFGQTGGTRIYLDYCEIPWDVQVATIDTENYTFWSDPGVDFLATLRAIQNDLTHQGNLQGASSITQQLVKIAVLGDASQNIDRKLNEAILALSVNQHYSKQDILTMYLNIISYGYNYEGIEAAAENFFHLKPLTLPIKNPTPVQQAMETEYIQNYTQCMHDRGEPMPKTITMWGAAQLQPWQATLLAAAPNNPNIYNPYANPQGALNRQINVVLYNMHKYGDDKYIYEYDAQGNKQYVSPGDLSNYTAQMLSQKNSKGQLLNIFANQYQGAANASQKLAPFFVDYVIQQMAQYFPNGEEGFATAGWNVYTTLDYGDPSITQDQLSRIYIGLDGTLQAKNYDAKKEGNWLSRVGLQQYAEYIVKRNITQDFPDYWYCDSGLSHKDYNYPIDYNTDHNYFATKDSCMETPLDQPYTNVNDGALTAIDPRNGDILAMVGGVDYNGTGDTKVDGGQNNITISPYRSMGSSFKPVVYATAMQMGWYPGLVLRDQPTCFPAAGTAEAHPYDSILCPGNYLPHNDEYFNWAGPEPLRIMLGNSLNTPAELALSFVGMRTDSGANASPLLAMAQRLGITSLKASNMGYTTAIGTQAVPLLQLTSAYGTFANQGYHVPPRAVLSIVRADGKVIEPYNPNPPGWQALSPQAAYMVTSMLVDDDARVADFGHDNPLHFYGRDVAGKTGTSDAQRDIVTMGYTPWLALGVWSGNADASSMDHIIGIAGAGYIFHDVMAFAIDRLHMPGQLPSRFAPAEPGGYFPVPPGMHRAVLNCHTGLAPWKGMNVLDPKAQCDPNTQDRVPEVMTPEFAQCGDPSKLPPYYPNETWNCTGSKSLNKVTDGWEPMDWGNMNQGVQTPGIDISWMIDNQDPTVP
jgi:membrane peptidoglycan carboxypeptidase